MRRASDGSGPLVLASLQRRKTAIEVGLDVVDILQADVEYWRRSAGDHLVAVRYGSPNSLTVSSRASIALRGAGCGLACPSLGKLMRCVTQDVLPQPQLHREKRRWAAGRSRVR